MGKKCLQHLLHKGSPGVQLIIAIRVLYMHLNFLDKGCDLSYSIEKELSSESADKLRSLAYLRRSEAFCLKDTEERGGCNGIILKLETRFIYA